jgi:hypothetical protein
LTKCYSQGDEIKNKNTAVDDRKRLPATRILIVISGATCPLAEVNL